jgi:hypothetical protein
VDATLALRQFPRLRVLSRWPRERRPSSAVVFFWTSLAVYMAAAAFVTFAGNNYALGADGVSRVAIANRILFSRDPHLAAMGFVWSPLPELVLVPLMPLKFFWPALVQQAFAGNMVSALFMAGAVYQLIRILEEVGVEGRLRWVLTGGFAVHPMIVLFAVNSMSEAQFLFSLLLLSRHLARWLRTAELGALIATGFYLAVCYLTRYEGIAAAGAVIALVAFATFRRASGERRRRLRLASLDAIIVSAPFVMAFVVWAVISWLITGIAFQQFSSAYGTEPQLQSRGLGGAQSLSQELVAATQAVHWVLSLEPLLPLVAIACLVVIVKRRQWAELGTPAVLCSVLAFMFWAHTTGTVLRSLRYFIAVIPLVVIMIGIVLARRQPATAGATVAAPAQPRSASRLAAMRLLLTRRSAAVLAAAAVLAVTVPVGYHAVVDPATNGGLAYAVQATLNRSTLSHQQLLASRRFVTDRAVSHYIDGLHLPRGAVLVDDFLAFVVVMSSTHPDQYVITSDRDFQKVLADPAGSGILYVLVPTAHDLGTLDAINRAYPGVYADGGGLGTLTREFDDVSDSEYNWRLYQVTPGH